MGQAQLGTQMPATQEGKLGVYRAYLGFPRKVYVVFCKACRFVIWHGVRGGVHCGREFCKGAVGKQGRFWIAIMMHTCMHMYIDECIRHVCAEIYIYIHTVICTYLG